MNRTKKNSRVRVSRLHPTYLPEDLGEKLRSITAANRCSSAEFLDPIIRGPIEAEYKRIVKQMAASLEK